MPRCSQWPLALLGLLLFVAPATRAATGDLTPEAAELAEYLHEFDHRAHASAEGLRSELAAPLLMVRAGYGGPAESRSLTREAVDRDLKTPLPAGFALQRAQILSGGPVPAANLIYK